MSDFISNFWSMYVAGITLCSIAACAILLWFTMRAKASTHADNTTGHVWDTDLREMNNPLPRWWVWLFIITIIFGLAYLAAYPGLGSYAGKFGWTSVGQHKAEMDKGNADVAPLYAKYAAMSVEDVAKDPQAVAIGERLFLNNCAACHGSDARGSKGFPNLTRPDNERLYAGTADKVVDIITNGRIGMMPPQAANVGAADDVKNVANYVLSLSNSAHDSARAALGKPKFEAVCAACHGADGKGNQIIGAINLTAGIWLHGFGEAAIIEMINKGKTNQMPAQKDRYTPEQIHVLAGYVWSRNHNTAAK